jgi:hypothetical protein
MGWREVQDWRLTGNRGVEVFLHFIFIFEKCGWRIFLFSVRGMLYDG